MSILYWKSKFSIEEIILIFLSVYRVLLRIENRIKMKFVMQQGWKTICNQSLHSSACRYYSVLPTFFGRLFYTARSSRLSTHWPEPVLRHCLRRFMRCRKVKIKIHDHKRSKDCKLFCISHCPK